MTSMMTTNSLWAGTVLWEPQEQKCQQSVFRNSDVAHIGRAGLKVTFLQWKMVK